jgi:hypothetical protein
MIRETCERKRVRVFEHYQERSQCQWLSAIGVNASLVETT